MSKLSSLLWRLFCTLAVFFYHMDREANARGGDVYLKQICAPNSYVKSCGNYVIGTNWLKGGLAYGENQDVTVPSYYQESDYTGDVEQPTQDYLSNSLKYFFGKAYVNNTEIFNESTELGAYDTKYNQTHGQLADVLERLSESGTSDVADLLLTQICNPLISNNIVCQPCPGDGKVDASSVGIQQDDDYDYDSYSIIAKTWKLYTISDCYMNEFTDSYGIFEYVNDASESQSCYYNYSKNDMVGTNFSQQTAKSSSY